MEISRADDGGNEEEETDNNDTDEVEEIARPHLLERWNLGSCPLDDHVAEWLNHARTFGDSSRSIRIQFGHRGNAREANYLLTLDLAGTVYDNLHKGSSILACDSA